MAHSDEPLQVSGTNSASEFGGMIWGIQLALFGWMIAALLLGFTLFAWLHYGKRASFSKSILVGSAPAVVCSVILLTLYQGKPPGYARDLAEAVINKGHASPLQNPTHSPLSDCHLTGGLIFYGSPQPGGAVAKGFWVEMPALQNGSNAERNHVGEALQQLLRLPPKGYSLQVSWWVNPEYRPELLRFQKVTERSQNVLVKRTRNLQFLHFWEQMQQGKLRREQVGIFLTRSLQITPPAKQSGSERSAVIEQLQTEFGELGIQISNILHQRGGKVQPMTDEDHIRVFAGKLNPSQNEDHLQAGFDPGASVAEVCWNSELRGLGARGFYLDEHYHGVLLLKRWPNQTYPTLMNRLTQLPFCGYEISVSVERLPLEETLAAEQKSLDVINQQLARKRDERLAVSQSTKDVRIRRLSDGSILPFSVEIIILARAKTQEQLSEQMLALKSAVNGLNGAQYLEVTLPTSARNAFFRSLPGAPRQGGAGLRLYGESTFVPDMLPLSSSFTGHLDQADAIYGGQGSLVGIRMFTDDGKEVTGQHAVVIGGTGAGKSLWLQNLLQQSEPGVVCTVIIEEGLSHAEYTRSFGVEPIEFRLDGRQRINGLDTRRQPLSAEQRANFAAFVCAATGISTDPDKAQRRHALVSECIERLCCDFAEEMLRNLSEPELVALVAEASTIQQWQGNGQKTTVEAFWEFHAWKERNPVEWRQRLARLSEEQLREFETTHRQTLRDLIFARLEPGQQLTLSSLREYLELNTDHSLANDCQLLATLLAPFCRGGQFGNLFDGPSTVELTGPVIHFELGTIPESARQVKALAGLLIVNDIRQHLISLPRNQRKRVVIEEVSRFLAVPGGETILRECYEQFRKFGVQVISVVQQYSRLADTPVRAAVIGNCRAFFLFNPGDRRDLERLAEDIGLSSVAREAILRFPRPDQQKGQKYSEFCYFHTDPSQPLCGTVRHVRVPEPPAQIS